MAEEEKFDREVRAKLKDQEAAVPAHLWEQISHTLPPEAPKGISIWKWWTGGAMGVLLISAVLYFVWNSADTNDTIQHKNKNTVVGNSSVNTSVNTNNGSTDVVSLTPEQHTQPSSPASGASSTASTASAYSLNRNVSGNSAAVSNKNAATHGKNTANSDIVTAGRGGDPGFRHTPSNLSASGSTVSNNGTNNASTQGYNPLSSTSANNSTVAGGSNASPQANQPTTGNTTSANATSNAGVNSSTGNMNADANLGTGTNNTAAGTTASSTPDQYTTGTTVSGNANPSAGTTDHIGANSSSNPNAGTTVNTTGYRQTDPASGSSTPAGNVDNTFRPKELVNGTSDGSVEWPAAVPTGTMHTNGASNNTDDRGDADTSGHNTNKSPSVVAASEDTVRGSIDSSLAIVDSLAGDSVQAKIDSTAKPQEEKSAKEKKEKKDRSSLFSVEGYAGVGYSAYGLKRNPDATVDSMGTVYMKSRFDSVSTSNNLNLSMGLRVNYKLSERFEVHTGIRYQQYQQSYSYNVQRFDSIYFLSTDTHHVNPLRHYTPIPYSGKEKTTFVTIPVGVTYKQPLNDHVSLYGRGAMELMLMKSSGWLAYDTVGTAYLSGKPTSSFNVGIYLSAGVNYQLKGHWSIFAEPYCAFTLKDMYGKSDLVKQKPSAYGLMVGVRYEF